MINITCQDNLGSAGFRRGWQTDVVIWNGRVFDTQPETCLSPDVNGQSLFLTFTMDRMRFLLSSPLLSLRSSSFRRWNDRWRRRKRRATRLTMPPSISTWSSSWASRSTLPGSNSASQQQQQQQHGSFQYWLSSDLQPQPDGGSTETDGTGPSVQWPRRLHVK